MGGAPTYGYPWDLNGNITDVLDGAGKALLHLGYGHDTTLATFDSVTLQTAGDAPGFTTTLDYSFVTANLISPGALLPTICGNDTPAVVATETTATDGLGRTKTYAFDPHGRLLGTVGPLGHVDGPDPQRRYGADGLLSGVAFGDKTACFGRDEFGDITDVAESGSSLRAESAFRHRSISYRKYPGGFSRVLAESADGGVQIGDAYEWDDSGNLTGLTDAAGVKYATVIPDTSTGRTKSVTYDDGRAESFDYLAGAVRQTRLTDPVSGQDLVTTVDPDSAGRPLHGVGVFGETRDWTWNQSLAVLDVLDITREAGVERHIYINTDGRLDTDQRFLCQSGTCDPEGTSHYAYDTAGRVRLEVDSVIGLATCSLYSPEGLLLETLTPRGTRTKLHYDALDRLTSIERGSLPSAFGTAWSDGCASSYRGSDSAAGTLSSWHFNDDQDMDASTDARGVTTNYTYDGLGRPIGVNDPAGSIRQIGYDDLDRVEWLASYDPLSPLLPGGGPAHQPPALDPNQPPAFGSTVGIGLMSFERLFHDDLGRLKERDVARFGGGDSAGWVKTSYIYDRPNRRVTRNDPGGVVRVTDSDGVGNVVHVAVSGTAGLVEDASRSFDYANRTSTESIAAAVPGGALVTTRRWSTSGLPTTVGASTGDELHRVDYDQFNRVHLVSGAGQGILQYQYDDLDRVRAVSRFTTLPAAIGGNVFLYDDDSNLSIRTDVSGVAAVSPTVQYTVDALSRVTNVTSTTGGGASILDYEGPSSAVRARRSNGLVSSYQRDAAGRVTSQTDYVSTPGASATLLASGPLPVDFFANGTPDGLTRFRTVSYGYDALGRVTSHGDDQVNDSPPVVSKSATLSWNSIGALTDEIGSSSEVRHRYDDRGLPIVDVVDGLLTARREYDAAGRLTNVAVSPGGFPIVVGNSGFVYDGVGGPSTETRANGIITSNTYDFLGRLVSSGAQKGSATVHSQEWGIPLDGIPRTEALAAGSWTHGSVFTIDELGRLLAESHGIAGAVPAIGATESTSGANDQVESLVATGDSKRYTLDGLDNWLTTFTSSGLNSPAIDGLGRYVAFDGKVVSHGSDGTQLDASGAVGSVGDLTLGPNPVGEPVSFGGAGIEPLGYDFDAMGRLVERRLGADATIIGYDGWKHVVEDRTATIHMAVFGQADDEVLQQLNVNFKTPVPAETRNQLDLDPPRYVTVAPTLDFAVTGSQTSVQVELETDTGQLVNCSYAVGTGVGASIQLSGCDGGVTPDTPIRVTSVWVSTGGGAAIHRSLSNLLYTHRDRMGSIAAVSDESGSIVELYDYKAYGARTIRDSSGSVRHCCQVDNVFGFQGHPHDGFSGYVDMRSRTYWPYLGQFLSPDPIGFAGGSNLYGFALGAPLEYTDTLGLAASIVPARESATASFWRASGGLLGLNYGMRPPPGNGLFGGEATQNMINAAGSASRNSGAAVLGGGVVVTAGALGGAAVAAAAPNAAWAGYVYLDTANPGLVGGVGALGLGIGLGMQGVGALGEAGGATTTVVIDATATETRIGLPVANGTFVPDATRVLQNVTDAAAARLAADPSLARGFLTPAQYAAGQSSPGLARLNYGNALENMVASDIEQSALHTELFERVGGPNQPDFIGVGSAEGQSFDITTFTYKSIVDHLNRPYGTALDFIYYSRPSNFVTLP
jgi:RHS repeat-associated protein